MNGNAVLRQIRELALPPGSPPLAPEPAVSLARARGGRAAVKHGATLERWLTAQHDAASLARLAYIRKVGAPTRVDRYGNPCEWCGRGPADFLGTLAGGRSVAIEAKSRERRVALSDIPEHQRNDLVAVEALGGLALLVVELRDYQSIFVIPWSKVSWRKCREGAKDVSTGHEELALWRWTRGSYLQPWLGCVP